MRRRADTEIALVADVLSILLRWAEDHPEFRVSADELAEYSAEDDGHGIDVAVWRSEDFGPDNGGSSREPPVLAVEVGKYESDKEVSDQLNRYIMLGAEVVWLVLPATHQVVVADIVTLRRYGLRDRLTAHRFLPGLEPTVADLFRRL